MVMDGDQNVEYFHKCTSLCPKSPSVQCFVTMLTCMERKIEKLS